MAGEMCYWGLVGVCVAGGHTWQGACVAGGACMAGGHAWQILRDTVNERAVRILLECILVKYMKIEFQKRSKIISI